MRRKKQRKSIKAAKNHKKLSNRDKYLEVVKINHLELIFDQSESFSSINDDVV